MFSSMAGEVEASTFDEQQALLLQMEENPAIEMNLMFKIEQRNGLPDPAAKFAVWSNNDVAAANELLQDSMAKVAANALMNKPEGEFKMKTPITTNEKVTGNADKDFAQHELLMEARVLLDRADALGFNLTITQTPLKPLAMRNTAYAVEAWEKR
jgi:hypothetical protein